MPLQSVGRTVAPEQLAAGNQPAAMQERRAQPVPARGAAIVAAANDSFAGYWRAANLLVSACFPSPSGLLLQLWSTFFSMTVDQINATAQDGRVSWLHPACLARLTDGEIGSLDARVLNGLNDGELDGELDGIDARLLNGLSDSALSELDVRVLNNLEQETNQALSARVLNGLNHTALSELNANVVNNLHPLTYAYLRPDVVERMSELDPGIPSMLWSAYDLREQLEP